MLNNENIKQQDLWWQDGKITSINLCSRNILNQLNYVVELANCNVDKDLKYSMVEEIIESMKKSCDSILKCLDVELKKGN